MKKIGNVLLILFITGVCAFASFVIFSCLVSLGIGNINILPHIIVPLTEALDNFLSIDEIMIFALYLIFALLSFCLFGVFITITALCYSRKKKPLLVIFLICSLAPGLINIFYFILVGIVGLHLLRTAKETQEELSDSNILDAA